MTAQRFVSKPKVVEAMQYDGSIESQRAIVNWSDGNVAGFFDTEYHLVVYTFHGPVRCRAGEWVVQSVERGDWWPVNDETFQTSYRPADNETEGA